MIKVSYLKSNIHQLIKEPIVTIMFILPYIISIIFKLIIVYIIPILESNFNLDIADYKGYILSFVFIISATMIGIVMGFLMLDDKDGKIIELLRVTPLGLKGYLTVRFSFSFISTFSSIIIGYYILNIFYIKLFSLIFITGILSTVSIIIGLLFFLVATDKVKGLTYAKGLNIIVIFGLSDLLKGEFIHYISLPFPTYWITRVLIYQNELLYYLFAIISTLLWLSFIYYLSIRAINNY